MNRIHSLKNICIIIVFHINTLGHVRVQCGNDLLKEVVLESVVPCSDEPVVPARGQQVKQVVGRMGSGRMNVCLSAREGAGSDSLPCLLAVMFVFLVAHLPGL